MTFVTRFAPSPTGPLHLGHAFSALLAYDLATASGGRFLLRIEDIDRSRARPEWEEQIYDDLGWLGIRWETPVRRQSDHLADYQAALNRLAHRGLLYPCICKRRDIQAALSAPQEGAVAYGPDGLIYPGTCRGRSLSPEDAGTASLRLNIMSAMSEITQPLTFVETGDDASHPTGVIDFTEEDLSQTTGDIVLARRDMGTSYHLSVVVDDAAQGVTHVVRGADLFEATKIHVVLQRLLAVPVPIYHHHRLIRDEAGKRLAKRDDARAISKYRADGATPSDIRRMVGLPTSV